MTKELIKIAALALTPFVLLQNATVAAEGEKTCFESRKGASEVVQRTINDEGLLNVRCSPTTNGVLWWGDPYAGTIPMGEMPEMIP